MKNNIEIKRHGLWKGGKPKCIDCGIKEIAYSSRGKRCRKCFRIFAVNNNATNWKGGKKYVKCYDCEKKTINYNRIYQRCFFCAHIHIGKQLCGANNPNWKNGKTKIIQLIRNSIRYKNWRNKIFKRDNYTCVKCNNNTGGNLEVDHIIRINDLLNMYNIKTVEDAMDNNIIWDIKIGRTLCKDCHAKTRTYGNKGETLISDMGIEPYIGIGKDISILVGELFNNKFKRKIDDIDALLILYQDNVYPFFDIVDGRIVSMLLMYTIETFSRRLGCIEEVVTLKEYRGIGKSSNLIKKVIEKAKKLKLTCIELTCKPELLKFYDKLGFEMRKNITMRKWINRN